MDILLRQLRIYAAALFAILLMANITASQAGAPCSDGAHYPGEATFVQQAGHESALVGLASDLAFCCSAAIGNCCMSAVVISAEAPGSSLRFVRSTWLISAPIILHGLEEKVQPEPPRIA